MNLKKYNMESAIKRWLGVIGLLSLGMVVPAVPAYALERVVDDFNRFVHAGENVIVNLDGSLEYFPARHEASAGGTLYDFSSSSRSGDRRDYHTGGRSTKLTEIEKIKGIKTHLTQDGYFGTGLAFTSTTEPVHVPVPVFLKRYPVYDWGMTVYFYPLGLAEDSVILESTRMIWLDKNGNPFSEPYRESWRISLVNETVTTELANLFHLGEERISLELTSSVEIELHRWNKLELSYNVQTGEVTQWLNGRISAVAVARGLVADSRSEAHESFYYFGFAPEHQQTAPLVFSLGENFNGRIDELSFHQNPLRPSLGQSVLMDRQAFFTAKWSSRVFRLKPFTRLRRVMINGTELANEATDVYVCSSADYFPERTLTSLTSAEPHSMSPSDAPAVSPVTCTKGLLDEDFMKTSEGFFYQIFFVAKNRTYPYPKWTELKLVYEIDAPPLAPILTDQKSFSNSILLHFRVGLEEDIMGYTLTYRSEQERVQQKIRIPLAELIKRKRNPLEYGFLLTGLRPGLLYTLELRAYDKIIEGKERVSLGAAQTLALTGIDFNAF